MNSTNVNRERDTTAPPIAEASNQSEEPRPSHAAGGRWIRVMLVAGLACLLLAAPAARADRSPPGCSGSGLGISLFTSVPDVHIGDTLYYSINVFNAPLPACDAGATNPAVAGAIRAYIITPDGVSNAVVLRRTYLLPGQADFYTNVVSYVVRAQDVRADGTVRATAGDEGDIHQNDTNSRGGGEQGVNTEVNLPCIRLTAQCVGGMGEGGAITFIGTVSNCGNSTLVGVTVTNFYDGGFHTVLFPTNLAIGQIAVFSGSWVPLNPCLPDTGTLTVRAVDEFTTTPRAVTSFTTVTCQNTLAPGIKVTKLCPAQPVSPGQLLTFSGSVSNTGNVTLTNVVVVNDQPASNTIVFSRATLAPGASATFTGSYTAPTNCSVTDTLIARASSACGIAVSDTATATCSIKTTPGIAVTAACPVAPVVPGGSLTYSGTVRNTGDIPLTNVVVVSDRPVANTTVLTVPVLDPGATTGFTADYTVPAGACSVTTTFRATGSDLCSPALVTNTASATCAVTTAPAIDVTLACPAVAATAGGSITYTGTVRNSGNVTLSNVFVVNSQPAANTPVMGPLTLAPGAASNFTATFTAPADACSVSSTVRATGNDTCTAVLVTDTASATCTLSTAPGILLTQLCPVTAPVPGALLTYSGTVRNTGNITLTNVVILNNLSGATPIFTAATLAPGAVANYSGSYLAPTNCSTTSTSTATGRSTCGAAVTNAFTATCPIATLPLIAVTAVCPVAPVVPGGSLTYSGTVRNTGNIPLTNVVVVSDRPAANTTVFTAAVLAPGASAGFTADYTVPANACSVATTFRATGGDLCSPAIVTNSATTTCAVTTSPDIAVTLACPAVPATAGGSITYTGTVRNSGNVTLSNVFVVHSMPAPNTAVAGPLTLLPGAVSNFTATFTAPADVCSVSSTVRATGNDNCTGVPVTNITSATCSLGTTPALVVTPVCPVVAAVPGGLLAYSGTVRNAGNVTLTNVVVKNNLSGATPVFTAAAMAPGATANFTGSYIAPTNCFSTSLSTATGRSVCGAAVTNAASMTCSILTAPRIAVTAACPTAPVVPGGSITNTGTVRNTGDISLTNVVVVSDRPAPNTPVFTAAVMAPGELAVFTSVSTVPSNACVVSSTFRATGNDLCSPAIVTNSVTAVCTVTTAPGIAVTLACPAATAATGGSITYTGTVRNSGNVTLNNVYVVNSLPAPNTPVMGPLTLAPGAVSNFTATFTAPADACSVSTTVRATGSDNCTAALVTNTASASCLLLTTPAIQITQVCPVIAPVPGGLATYSGTVRNAGDITLTNVVVINSQSGATPVFTAAAMAPGAVAEYSGSYLAPTNCFTASTSTATGRSICGVAVTNSASATCPVQTAPRIEVTAACPAAPVLPGGSLTNSGTVRNTGNITLTNVVVVSDRPAPNTTVFTAAVMAPGASAVFSSVSVVPAGACSVTTFFRATGNDLCTPLRVTNSVTTVCGLTTAPAIAVTLACPVLPTATGAPVTYTGTVRNSGNVTLNNVVVVNNHTSPSRVLAVASLAPGATADFTASFTALADACSVSSTVIATGSDDCSAAMVTNTASATCPLVTAPRLIVTQNCPPTPASLGGVLTYSGSVSNAGNITLTNVVVLNSLGGATPVYTAATLAPGAAASFAGSYPVPATSECSITSSLSGSGYDKCDGARVTAAASATCPILTAPAIVVTQWCPTTPVVQGGILTYSGVVSNAGNVTLSNIIVLNNWPAAHTVVFTTPLLAPGAATNFTGSYVVPANCCVAWSTVVATGQDCYGATVTHTDTGTCIVLTSPRIVLTKVCGPGVLRPGDRLTYSGMVSNAGDIALMNLTVVNSQPGAGTILLGPIALAAGESVPYTASYIVPVDFCGEDTVTAEGLDACTRAPVASHLTTTCPIAAYTPRISITKHCPALPTPHGGQLVFSGTVRNLGDVTLVNVYVINDQPTNNTPVLGPVTLAPGAFLDFTGSYTAPPVCCQMIDTLTARAQDRCGGARVAASATAVCPLLYTPGIALVQGCPSSPLPMGSLYPITGYVTNTGDAILTNVVVYTLLEGQHVVLMGPVDLAPGEYEEYAGSVAVPMNACALVVSAYSQETCKGTWVTNSTSCPAGTPGIMVTETCAPAPVSAGSSVLFGGMVSNTGSITLTNVRVFSSQPTNNTLVLGPVTLAPGASAPFAGSYIALGGSNPATNVVVATNLSGVITTNRVAVFTSTNTVRATGTDSCQGRTLVAAADCLGSLTPGPRAPAIGALSLARGQFSLSFASDPSRSYTVQFKNTLSDPVWTDLETVVGTGEPLTVMDAVVPGQPTRFYRVISTP